MRKFFLLCLTTIVFYISFVTSNFAGGWIVTQKIYGYVKDAKNLTGIYQAKVELRQNGIVITSTSSRSDGYYLISTFYKGSFDVYASKQGYNSQNKNVFVNSGKTVKLDFFLSLQTDSTPPTPPVVSDEGSFTNSTSQLSASWFSSDPESGISEYQYSINNSPEPLERLIWRSVGTNMSVKASSLSLSGGETYYFLVKAKNGVGLWSGIGVSDGIKVNRQPAISVFKPANYSSFEEGNIVVANIEASDPDSDPLQYQFSINGIVKRLWSASSQFTWTLALTDLGAKTIKGEVKDDKGLNVKAESEIFIFRKPIL